MRSNDGDKYLAQGLPFKVFICQITGFCWGRIRWTSPKWWSSNPIVVCHWPFKRRNVHYRVKPLKFIKNLFSNFAATRRAKKCPWRWEEVCSKKTLDNNWPSTMKMMTDDRSVSSKLVPTELLLIPRAIYKQKKTVFPLRRLIILHGGILAALVCP